MPTVQAILHVLPDAAASPLALVAYVIACITIVILCYMKWTENVLTLTPSEDRRAVITKYLGLRNLPKDFDPESYVRLQSRKFLLIAFIAFLSCAVLIIAAVYTRARDVVNESSSLSQDDLNLRLLIEVPGYELPAPAMTENHRLIGTLAGSTFYVIIEPAIPEARKLGGRGGGGAGEYRFVSKKFYFMNPIQIPRNDLAGKFMEIRCDPKEFGVSPPLNATCQFDLFVSNDGHFRSDSLQSQPPTYRIPLGS